MQALYRDGDVLEEFVTPAKAGVQGALDSRLRGNDGRFLRRGSRGARWSN